MTTDTAPEEKNKLHEQAAVTTGPAAAALVSSDIGVLTIGLMTTGAVISEGLRNALNWWNPAGPLTGKTGVGVILWLSYHDQNNQPHHDHAPAERQPHPLLVV
ncbi:MAG TPA: hypothetical protein PLD25_26980 [Chloroflexota bacterium]|nr:hypothetical protein [Chloroflexota bacterium]HUM67249.1 hypothetical protein [Chloroflexota bacterium]